MINPTKNKKTIGITGASGALGIELTKLFRQKGYKVIGFTHSKNNYEKNLMDKNTKKKLTIKKIILGPFKSELNPLGIMSPEFVSKKIYDSANSKNYLVIISPNPLTYILFPLKELFNFFYCQIIYKYKP